MNQKEKEILLGVIVLVVILIAITLIGGGLLNFNGEDVSINENTETSNELEDSPEESGELSNADFEEAQRGFPSNFPFEEAMQESNSYYYDLNNSNERQTTVEYFSDRTIEENYQIFKNYLESEGYAISNDAVNENSAFIYGISDESDISIFIEESNGGVLISASYFEL